MLSGAIYFVFLNKNSLQSGQVSNGINEYQQVSGNEQTFKITPSDNKENSIYTDSQYRFSFEYPKDFTVTKFQEGEDGDTILVQYREQSEQVSTSINKYPDGSSFQIFISPFDEPGPLTKERILQDLPDLIIKNPEQRVLKNGAVALVFFSEEQSLGETREIWFIHNNHLYQITTNKELDGLVAKILETWRF
ncbi:MAG: hypothetical protein A2V69_00610 [Candidatus Portnoybacteria bacterium RBG_13_40_8]|uniref:DUF4367 domain-containing protein n=1 Tax=Candidatus Portnoybacteria bacterium RBG_13_40_8 TaxID=1801990 RepID=A0A1G2F509_9BACT|nr:MAG: hypothetical protein A2V69_00610 [Candidatus Portnoybacteria bacterium RBG_13_40_8]